MKPVNRRHFLRTALAAAGAALWACTPQTEHTPTPPPAVATAAEPSSLTTFTPSPEPPTAAPRPTAAPSTGSADLAVSRGSDPEVITRAAILALGGMERFVQSGSQVVIKPNICVDYHTFEYAATTNPQVVAALVKLSLEAGAKRVRVMDTPFGGTGKSTYQRSGIREAVEAAGGEMEVISPIKFATVKIPDGRDIQSWKVYQPALDADVLIDVPIAKHHSLAGLTLGGKNLMGLVPNPNQIHINLHQRIADLASLIRPTLTVVDAVRILMANGPTGGSLDDVKKTDTVIASADLIAADAYAATLFGMQGADIEYIRNGAEMGLGTLDLSAIKIEELQS